mgnify:CR=1 FL=1
MIDHGRWIGTLPLIKNKDSDHNTFCTNPNKWTDTIPKQKTKNGIKKFSLTLVLFVIGLILVSTIKNKTRNLQKEIYDLKASISDLGADLHKATLDYEVITSPENISQLAEKYLETELVYYKKSQIKELHEKAENPTLLDVTKDSKLKSKIKLKVAQKIEEKKIELQKLKELYKQPEKIPDTIKISLARRIEKKKVKLKKLYQNPTQSIDIKKIQKWGVLQLVKAVLGLPMIPGK